MDPLSVTMIIVTLVNKCKITHVLFLVSFAKYLERLLKVL